MGCSVDPYNWQIMIYCVWFTSATHLATIPILKGQLYNEQATISRLSVTVRAILMTVVLIMLVSSLVPTGHPAWSSGLPDRSALCFYDYKFPREVEFSPTTPFAGIWLSWSIGLVTITFFKRLVELITPPKTKQTTLSLQPTFRNTKLQAWNKYMDENMGRHAITRFLWNPSQETFRTVWRLLESLGWHVSYFTPLFTHTVILYLHPSTIKLDLLAFHDAFMEYLSAHIRKVSGLFPLCC